MKAWVPLALIASLSVSQPATISPLIKNMDLRDWLSAAAEHRPGVEDAALRRIAAWSGTKLLRMLDLVEKETSTGALNDLLERAAVLHGDIMLLRPEASPPWRDTAEIGGSSILVKDGQRIGNRSLDPHIQFARKIFTRMREPVLRNASGEKPTLTWEEEHRRNPRIHQWYRAVSTELAARHWLADLRPHLEHARRVLDDTPATMFDSACFSEVIASAEIQRAVPPRLSPSKMNTLALRVESDALLLDEAMNLVEAERYYRDAIKLAPGYAEARVRLARVLSRRNRHADAFALLQAPLDGADVVVRYYGALALGEAAEATQKPDIAREAYERAVELFPKAQSPLLALMRLARERADEMAAKELAARFARLKPQETSRVDPWWAYFDCHGRNRRTEPEKLWSLYRAKEAR